MKALVGAFNQEKALVRAFSVIVQLHRLIDLRHYHLAMLRVRVQGGEEAELARHHHQHHRHVDQDQALDTGCLNIAMWTKKNHFIVFPTYQ